MITSLPARRAFPQTKFHRPPVRQEHVERAGLLAALDAAASAKVVIVCAPPGFGKSTLLAQWAARQVDDVAWLSLEAEDTGERFWAAVIEAVHPFLGSRIGDLLAASDALDLDLRDAVLVPLLDAMADRDEPLDLVLDDLHAVEDAATLEALDWWLERLPRQHRVLVTTRLEPTLRSLNRLRVGGEVMDVRTDDLRFGTAEAAEFLNTGLGLALDDAQIAELDRTVEGWPAALYLAAMRLRLGDEVGEVVAQLTANDADLIGHLTDEVLRSLPPDDRQVTLEAAVLDRFSQELCAHVVGTDAGAFRRLVRGSLLVVPLDESRTWFRFHHLLRDVLRVRLAEAGDARLRALHRAAGEWFETEGGESELDDAVHHLLAAQDWDRAAGLLARHAVRFVQSGAMGGRAREWLAAVPVNVVRGDARYCFVAALLAALDGDGRRFDELLAAGERAGWTGPMPDGTPSFDLAAQALRGMLATGDLGASVADAERALSQLPVGGEVRALVQAFTSWHMWLLGRVDDAEALARATTTEHDRRISGQLPLVGALPCAVLALSATERGDLEVAALLVERAVALRDAGTMRASPHALPVTCAAARLHTATGHADRAVDACRRGLALAPDWRGSSLMVPATLLELARAHQAAGDAVAAGDAQRQARRRMLDVRDGGTLPAALDALGPSPITIPDQRPSLRDVDGVDELSERELEVLRALTGDGSLREIGNLLFISYNTVKTHSRTLYAKLAVTSREEAVERGRALGLIPGGPTG